MADVRDQVNRMIEQHLKARGIRGASVIRVMQKVPREEFVPGNLVEFAYEDAPLSIGEGQTISQPFIVALMIELLELSPSDRVLEIGAGSGYAAAPKRVSTQKGVRPTHLTP